MNLYLNGEYLPLEQGRISVEDRGFQFGDGVYEVIRVYRGKPFRLGKHLARLEQSVKGIEMPLPEPLVKIEEVCRTVIQGLEEAQIYLQVTRGSAPRLHAFPPDIRPTFVAYARPVTRPPEDRVYTLKSVVDDRWGRCNLKTVCLLPNVLGRQKAADAGCDEGLFVRPDNTVTEGTASNAFFVRDGALFTHPADNRILNGVTREAVLEIARQKGVRVRHQAVTLAEAAASEEVFITGTVTEIGPVVALDGKPIGSGKPGPVTRKLRAAYRELTEKECA
jgi:D-alanine transaminase